MNIQYMVLNLMLKSIVCGQKSSPALYFTISIKRKKGRVGAYDFLYVSFRINYSDVCFGSWLNCRIAAKLHTKERPTTSTVKHHILHIFFDNRKRTELSSPTRWTSIWCFTLNVISRPKSCQMSIICGRHCTFSNMSGINILMENNQVTSKKRKKEESGENGLTYGNRPSASCIPGERINILSGKK